MARGRLRWAGQCLSRRPAARSAALGEPPRAGYGRSCSGCCARRPLPSINASMQSGPDAHRPRRRYRHSELQDGSQRRPMPIAQSISSEQSFEGSTRHGVAGRAIRPPSDVLRWVYSFKRTMTIALRAQRVSSCAKPPQQKQVGTRAKVQRVFEADTRLRLETILRRLLGPRPPAQRSGANPRGLNGLWFLGGRHHPWVAPAIYSARRFGRDRTSHTSSRVKTVLRLR